MKSCWLLLTLIAAPVAAQDFGARYPAGSILDGVQAQVVLKEADAEMTRIAQHAKVRDAECLRGFFVNSCREDVRREKELAEREVRRVRVEARDVQRRIEAERVAKRRSDDEAARAAEDAQRPQKESKARDAANAREATAKQREETLATKGEVSAQGSQAHSGDQDRPQQTQSRMTAEERAENARKFQQKQEQAQKRAQAQEVKRNENEQRRAEKRKRIEEQEAAREEIRKKAAESIK